MSTYAIHNLVLILALLSILCLAYACGVAAWREHIAKQRDERERYLAAQARRFAPVWTMWDAEL